MLHAHVEEEYNLPGAPCDEAAEALIAAVKWFMECEAAYWWAGAGGDEKWFIM